MPGLWPTKPTDSTESDRARRAIEQHRLARVVEPDLLLQLDPARPMRGEDLGGLLGAQRARVDEHLRAAGRASGERGGDAARVVASAICQRPLIVVLPNAGLGLGVTDQEQAAHDGRTLPAAV